MCQENGTGSRIRTCGEYLFVGQAPSSTRPSRHGTPDRIRTCLSIYGVFLRREARYGGKIGSPDETRTHVKQFRKLLPLPLGYGTFSIHLL